MKLVVVSVSQIKCLSYPRLSLRPRDYVAKEIKQKGTCDEKPVLKNA